MSNQTASRYEQIRQKCLEFHRENPEVYSLFCRFTFELIERGFKHYSAKAVFERIRWEFSVCVAKYQKMSRQQLCQSCGRNISMSGSADE